MPKKIKFESFIYQFLIAANDEAASWSPSQRLTWNEFVDALEFQYQKGVAIIGWEHPTSGSLQVDLRKSGISFYVRGDTPDFIGKQDEADQKTQQDSVKEKNACLFRALVSEVVEVSGFGK